MEKLLLDIDECAVLLGISKSSLYRDYQKIEIPYVKIGGNLRFPTAKVLNWLDKKTKSGTNKRIKI
jgi:excisionase family DNA binding protein